MSTEMQQSETVVAELEALVAEGGGSLSQSALEALAERVAERVAEKMAGKLSASAAPSAKGGKTSGRGKKAAEGGEKKEKRAPSAYNLFCTRVAEQIGEKGANLGLGAPLSVVGHIFATEGVKEKTEEALDAISNERILEIARGLTRAQLDAERKQKAEAKAAKKGSSASAGSAAKSEPEADAEEGAEEKPKKASAPRKCSACKQTGHTKAKCTASGSAEAKPAPKKAEPKAAEPVEDEEEAEEGFGEVAEPEEAEPAPAPTPKPAEPRQSLAEKLKAKKAAAKSAPAANPYRLKRQNIDGEDYVVNALNQVWLEDDGRYIWVGVLKTDGLDMEAEEPTDMDTALFELEE